MARFMCSERRRHGRSVRSLRPSTCAIGAAALVLGNLSREMPALALQPVDAFVARSQETNPDLRVSEATARQREAEVDRSTGALLPTVQAQGTYTYNQYVVAFPASMFGGAPGSTLTILPQNQLDGAFTLTVPVVDVGAWDRRASAKATFDSSVADLFSQRLDVSRRVARSYYQLVANEAVLQSAEHNLQLSRDNAAITIAKRSAGTASELDVQRARGDVARAEQDVAAANLSVLTERRSLETLSGLTPEPASAFPVDDLHAEAPLAAWLSAGDRVPPVQSAMAALRSAEASTRAADAAWLPTVTASAQERVTNAPSITLHNEYYLLQLSASWKLDATIPAAAKAARANADAAEARADGTRRQVEDAIFNDWQQVDTSIQRAKSARSQVEAALQAADLARDRYQGGIATQLDVLQAEQDLFRADVARIQADADLSYARASLRLDTGHPVGDPRR